MRLHIVLFTLLALGGVASAEAHCYGGERLIVEVNGVDRIGTQIICDGRLVRIEVEQPRIIQPPVVFAPPPVYVTPFVPPRTYVQRHDWQYSPPTYEIVQPFPVPPPAVYLGRDGVGVYAPGFYFEFGGGRNHHHYR